jgi:gluconate:H+ symporter, GntP family
MSPIIILIIGLTVVLGGILVAKLHPILSLLCGALIVGLLTTDDLLLKYAADRDMSDAATKTFLNQSLGERVAVGFGDTCTKVGLLIVLASIIGKCLLDSGAAERIVRTMLSVFGERRAPAAFMVSSFALGIPIFFDTVFYLMIPLARAMGVRLQRSYSLFVIAIIAGGTMAHSLVPPTPGPLFAASAFGVSIGMMIIVGAIVGLICSVAGLIYGAWANRREYIPLRSTNDTTLEELQAWLNKDTSQLPSFFLSNLPIALPVVLIAFDVVVDSTHVELTPWVANVFAVIGHPVIALFIAALISLAILAKQRGYNVKELKNPVEDSISSAGTIILITASGGAFGAMLQQTSIGNWLAEMMPDYGMAALPLAFLITAVIRTAQGSATVAMITAVGMLSAFQDPAVTGFHPVYLAVVVGCGSKLFAWMNDSGFWIICKMSGFTETETLRNSSVMMAIMGVTGLLATMLMAWLFPLV